MGTFHVSSWNPIAPLGTVTATDAKAAAVTYAKSRGVKIAAIEPAKLKALKITLTSGEIVRVRGERKESATVATVAVEATPVTTTNAQDRAAKARASQAQDVRCGS